MVVSLHMVHLDEQRRGEDTLFGYKVPFFQRANDCWIQKQQIAFVESMYMGANIGSFMVNIPNSSAREEFVNVLLDGLQRMTALKAYFNGEFGVEGEDGQSRLWTELDSGDRAHLLRISFPWVMTRYDNLDDLIVAYDRHNFGGTPHTAEDRSRLLEGMAKVQRSNKPK